MSANEGLAPLSRQVPPAVLKGGIAGALAVGAAGLYLRFTGLRDVFCMTPDEIAELIPGIRLHALPWFNFDAAPRYNFFKSSFYSQHGLGDVVLYYLGSGILSLLGLSVTEKTLFAVGGVTNLFLMVAVAVFCYKVLRDPVMGVMLVALIASSAFYIFVSKSGWGRLSFVPLVQISLLLTQWLSDRSGRLAPRLLFWGSAFFVAMTDGLYIVACVMVLGLTMREGPVMRRLASMLRDRTFVMGLVAWFLGFVVDLGVAAAAAAKGSNLTLLRYIQLRGSHGSVIPATEMLGVWAQAIDWYFPFRGGWVLVLLGFFIAVLQALRGHSIAVVCTWFIIASAGVIRYASGLKIMGLGVLTPTWINAYSLALPSYLLAAYLFSRIIGVTGLTRPAAAWGIRWGAVGASAGILLGLAFYQSFGLAYALEQTPDQMTRRDACRTVKAVGHYIRESGPPNAYVFHLSGDVFLGAFGEFYYGLSYSRSSRPEDPNRLLDFGVGVFGKKFAPEEFYKAYGVPHFDYYVDFLTEVDPLKSVVVPRLLESGARIVLVVRHEGRDIGRVLSYRPLSQRTLEYREASAAWDRTHARLNRLFQQPLAGTSYHFGYNWRHPEP